MIFSLNWIFSYVTSFDGIYYTNNLSWYLLHKNLLLDLPDAGLANSRARFLY